MRNPDYYKDVSIFQGWKEFLTPAGMMRAEYQGNDTFTLFLKKEEDTAFIHVGAVRGAEHATPEYLYDRYGDMLLDEEDSDEGEEIEEDEEEDNE